MIKQIKDIFLTVFIVALIIGIAVAIPFIVGAIVIIGLGTLIYQIIKHWNDDPLL